MKKWIKILMIIIAIVAITGAYVVWTMMQAPMYQVGDSRSGKYAPAPEEAPIQTGQDNYWDMEEDISLYHFSQGTGRNVLIIHGGPGMPYTDPWIGLEGLGDSFTFHYYDQRGAGRSSRPITEFDNSNMYENMQYLEAQLGISAQLADIERIRLLLGEDKLVIIGHSFGGLLATLYASEYPEHVEAMVLVAPAPLLKMPMEVPGLFDSIESRLSGPLLAEYQEYMKSYFDFSSMFTKTDQELSILNGAMGKYFSAALDKEGFTLPEAGKPGGWMVQAMYFSMGQRHDYTPSVGQVSAPTLILHGDQDIVQTKEASELYLDLLPNSEMTIIPKASHMMYNDQPTLFEQAVGKFLGPYVR